ncbi:hypothetical protein P9314_05945 [Paenibacillus validus]|uniref:Uncharacterized protein n=1 Tax=Paenibacillus validus TaxID=44253 RepID=A0A7X3CRT5_9BACL|nr:MULTISPECIES: hypothetical protein [Paenibacillus]MED4600243.1 hypothetical protein [Paenibacillus validus]MED4605244.1 hypothetical protein [Paenibacillus validus]MUG69297.1 hypothetical protein [Paenibacillus validus]
MDIKVTPLYEMIEGFLEEMNTIHAETTWERIAENADYDRYIVTRKQETVILHSDYGDTAFRIVEAPLENRIYVLSMGPMDDEVVIHLYDAMEEAISSIMEQLNAGSPEVRVDHIERSYIKTYEADGYMKTIHYAYDTVSSLSLKIAKLLA